jgi:hypothetical protein
VAEYYKISRFLHVEDKVGSVSLGGETIRDDAGFDINSDTVVVPSEIIYDGEGNIVSIITEHTVRRIKTQQIGPNSAVQLEVGAAIELVGVRICCIVNTSTSQRITVCSDAGSTVVDFIRPGEARILEPSGDYIPFLKSQTSQVTVKHLAVAMLTG